MSDDITIEAKEIAFNALFNLFNVNFIWTDEKGEILGCNKRMVNCLHMPDLEKIVGKQLLTVSNQSAWENTQKVIATGESITAEECHTDEQGDTSYFLSLKNPIKSKEGNTIGVAILAIDVTKQKKTELELIKSLAEVSALNEAKTQFLINMRHDIRTPCSGILSLAKFLESQETDPEKKVYLNDLAKCADALLNHMTEILGYVKVESGEISIKEQEFDVKHVLVDVYQMLKPCALTKDIKFDMQIDDELPNILIGDAGRLQRILMNVVANAIKFTHHGFVKITAIWLLPSSNTSDKGILQVDIEDSGIGIPDDKQEMIFDRFTKLSSSPEGKYKGQGLGLNIVKQFVGEIGGKYFLRSKLGEGTLFKLVIPYKIPLFDFTKTTVVTTSPVDTKIEISGYKNILLVEDNDIVLRITKDILETNLPCKVDIATTGRDALTLIEEKAYDLVLLDIGLADMDGITVSEQIRANRHTMPIVAVTAHLDEEDTQKCLDAGMNELFIKPLLPDNAKTLVKYF